MNILAFDTSSQYAALSLMKENEVVFSKNYNEYYNSHAEILLKEIKEVLTTYNLPINEIDGLVFCQGPGSYTGLRIGLSVAKGICYALDIPLYFVDTLTYMTAVAKTHYTKNDCFFLPMIDARREEVYMAILNKHLKFIKPINNLILTKETVVENFTVDKPLVAFGLGAHKLKKINASLGMDIFFLEEFDLKPNFLLDLGLNKIKENKQQDIVKAVPLYFKPFFNTQNIKKAT